MDSDLTNVSFWLAAFDKAPQQPGMMPHSMTTRRKYKKKSIVTKPLMLQKDFSTGSNGFSGEGKGIAQYSENTLSTFTEMGIVYSWVYYIIVFRGEKTHTTMFFNKLD